MQSSVRGILVIVRELKQQVQVTLEFGSHEILLVIAMADISIQHFYGGRSVFVTGFTGKVLVEKLLRSCSDKLKTF
jgi:hypothetical protein